MGNPEIFYNLIFIDGRELYFQKFDSDAAAIRSGRECRAFVLRHVAKSGGTDCKMIYDPFAEPQGGEM